MWKRKLNVSHIATMTRWGGVERLLLDFLAHSHVNVEHSLIITSGVQEISIVARNTGVRIFEPTRRFRYDFSLPLKMAAWLRSNQIDIVHAYNAYAGVWGNAASLLAQTPTFLTYERGTIWKAKPPLSWFDRWGHQRAKFVVANSQVSCVLLNHKYSIPKSKVHIVYNAVPEIPSLGASQARALMGVDPDAVVVGSIGRLDTPKDYATLVESASTVCKSRQDVMFVLIGGGPLEDELRAEISRLGLQRRFVMTGPIEDARRLIYGFDLVVNTSIRESFGNVLIEAALCGKAVIAPSIDGIPEAVLDGETGVLLRPTRPVRKYWSSGATPIPEYVVIDGKIQPPKSLDAQYLAEEILKLLASPETLHRYGENGKARASKLFSLERYVREIDNLYLLAAAGE